jgi:hypothetical protein
MRWYQFTAAVGSVPMVARLITFTFKKRFSCWFVAVQYFDRWSRTSGESIGGKWQLRQRSSVYRRLPRAAFSRSISPRITSDTAR